jgi:Domain of unknown function (DUF4389)
LISIHRSPRVPGLDLSIISAMNEHPVTLHVMDDLRRSRLTVFFRGFLVLPHYIWLFLWGIPVAILQLVTWLVVLITGRLPKFFHRFFSSYLRYQTHVQAYANLVANPFPAFNGEYGSYPVDLELPAEPQRQNRWGVFFRFLAVFPLFFMMLPLMFLMGLVFPWAWVASLILGRIPRGFRDLLAYVLRYQMQMNAYISYFLTDRYPNSSPYVGMSFEAPVVAEAPTVTEVPAVVEAPVTPEAPATPEAPEAPSET